MCLDCISICKRQSSLSTQTWKLIEILSILSFYISFYYIWRGGIKSWFVGIQYFLKMETWKGKCIYYVHTKDSSYICILLIQKTVHTCNIKKTVRIFFHIVHTKDSSHKWGRGFFLPVHELEATQPHGKKSETINEWDKSFLSESILHKERQK